MSDTNERHKTYDADALHFIACELTHDINNLDDGENRVRWNNRAMVLALNTITVKEGELAIAQRYVSDANEEINRLRAENAALRELVEGVPLYWAVPQEWIAKRDAILNGGAK